MENFDFSMVSSIIRRRYPYFILAFVGALALTGFVAYSLPPSYEAKATILIESQRIPSELALTTVNVSPGERLKVIEQRLLARDSLLAIAGKFSLYRKDGEAPSPTSIVAAMRNAISIKQISVSRSARNTQIVGFSVSFQYTDATTSARVTNELVTTILSQNLETRIGRAAETSDFFVQQLKELEKELSTVEEQMAAFKRDNEGALPDTLNDRRGSLSEISLQLRLVEQQLRAARDFEGGESALDGGTQQLSFRLESKELTHKSYLDRRDQLTPLFAKGFVSKRTMDDLDRQIALSEIEIASIKSQLSQSGFTADPEERIKLLESQRDELQLRADELGDSIQRTPGIEFEMAAMNRVYENLRAEYRQTKAKLTDAEIGEQLEQDRQAERFEVLEQATIPDGPSEPNRTQIVAAGGGGAVIFGAAIVFLLEFLDKSIRTAGDLERRLKVRPIAVIPYVTTKREKRRRIGRGILTICLFLFAIVCVMVLADRYVMPMDLLAERAWLKIEPILSKLNLTLAH